MLLWSWQKTGLVSLAAPEIALSKPTVLICGGSFNVDNPPQTLIDETPLVTQFFDFIMQYITADREIFKSLICGSLEGKLQLNYFSIQKLLGLISAVPGHPLYPESLSPAVPDSVDILEVSYTDTHSCIDNIHKTYTSGDYYSSDARHLADKLFLPVLQKYKDVESIRRQFSLITLFGISYGSNFIIEVENALTRMLTKRGYGIEEQNQILRSIYAISVSNMANVRGAKGPRFSAVYFEGTNDHLAAWMNPYKTPVSAGANFSIVSLADHRILVLMPVTVTATEWIEILPEFDYFWLDNDKAAHYTPFYTMRCIPESFLPECVERVLRNAVSRGQKPSGKMSDLLKSALAFSGIAHPRPSEVAAVDRLVASAGYG